MDKQQTCACEATFSAAAKWRNRSAMAVAAKYPSAMGNLAGLAWNSLKLCEGLACQVSVVFLLYIQGFAPSHNKSKKGSG